MIVSCLDIPWLFVYTDEPRPMPRWITPRARAIGDDASRRAWLLRKDGPETGVERRTAGRSVGRHGFLAIGKRSRGDRRLLRARRRGRDGLSWRSCRRSEEQLTERAKIGNRMEPPEEMSRGRRSPLTCQLY